MSESHEIYLNDIQNSIKKIEKYTKGITKRDFLEKEIVVDAVIRNLEIIGEAAKKMPFEFRKKHQEIEWKKIAGLRDVLIHSYSGIDFDLLWEIVTIKVPLLKDLLNKIKNDLK